MIFSHDLQVTGGDKEESGDYVRDPTMIRQPTRKQVAWQVAKALTYPTELIKDGAELTERTLRIGRYACEFGPKRINLNSTTGRIRDSRQELIAMGLEYAR